MESTDNGSFLPRIGDMAPSFEAVTTQLVGLSIDGLTATSPGCARSKRKLNSME